MIVKSHEVFLLLLLKSGSIIESALSNKVVKLLFVSRLANQLLVQGLLDGITMTYLLLLLLLLLGGDLSLHMWVFLLWFRTLLG